MFPENVSTSDFTDAINRGFSKQSFLFDATDLNNAVLRDLRSQVYAHVEKYIRPQSRMLELNAGTGLDALHFLQQGHYVHATDLADGMIGQIRTKIAGAGNPRFTCQQVSFENLDEITLTNLDYIFSNFGGLNCTNDLTLVTRHLPRLLKRGAYVTVVIMPPVCPWELLSIFKGNWKRAFRRFGNKGAPAHLEGEYFSTYYHSLGKIRIAFGSDFHFIETEGLAALSPPPHRADIPLQHPRLYGLMRRADAWCKNSLPFNRWADHLIVTFQYNPR